MCGINGILLKKYDPQISRRIEKMNGSLLHRGPDMGKTVVVESGKIAIGHRRLSIIDLFRPAYGISIRAVGVKL